MLSLLQTLDLILNVVCFVVIVHLIMSWLIAFQVLNSRQQFVALLWDGLNRMLEPIYTPIRRALPNMGGLDITPMVVLVGISIIRIVIRNNIASF